MGVTMCAVVYEMRKGVAEGEVKRPEAGLHSRCSAVEGGESGDGGGEAGTGADRCNAWEPEQWRGGSD